MYSKKRILLALALLLLLSIGCGNQGSSTGAEGGHLTATEALSHFNQTFYPLYNSFASDEARKEAMQNIAADHLKMIDESTLEGEELLAKAQLLGYAGRIDESLETAAKLKGDDDLLNRHVDVTSMSILAQAEQYDRLEEMLNSYQQTYEPRPDFIDSYYGPLGALLFHYEDTGRPELAADLIMREVDRLNPDAPYSNYNVLAFAETAMAAAGRLEEFTELARRLKSEFESRVARHTDSEETAPWARQYQRLASSLDNALTRIELVGQQAPGFEFNHYFNTDDISLQQLRGKVVMIDFWANWCSPCKSAFPGMRELYDEYKDEGFVILGVTSLQGRFIDGVTQETNIGTERELELTEEFIERYEINWPIAFADTTFDSRYGVTGIPTFAVVDTNGIVRMVRTGSGETNEQLLRELIPQLLAE